MTETICIFEGPRSGGTSLSYAVFNGLRSLGYKCELDDEPFHPRWLRQMQEVGGEEAVQQYKTKIVSPEITRADYVVQKWMAAWLFENENQSELNDTFADLVKKQMIFLIRDPREMLNSYRKAMEVHHNIIGISAEEEDFAEKQLLGIAPLYKTYNFFISSGLEPIVIDRTELLKNIPNNMQQLCKALSLPFSEGMTKWQKVDIETPPWGEHWYQNLRKSTGLNSYHPPKITLNDRDEKLAEKAKVLYELLYKSRFTFQ